MTAAIPRNGHDGGHEHGAPYQPVFVGARRQELDELFTKYQTKMACLLPALWIVQDERGWVSEDAMAEVAQLLELTPAYVKGVVTFYTMYNQHPVGKYLIQVCPNISCNLCGGDAVFESFLKHTGTEAGETSANGLWTVMEVECLGACGFPTAVQINEHYYENVRPQDVPAILERLT